MENQELDTLWERLRNDNVFREKCLDAVLKRKQETVMNLLEEKGIKDILQQPLNEINNTMAARASSDIFVWCGKYHFLKPDTLKKSVLYIDELKKEATINGHSLEIQCESQNTFQLSSTKNKYNLTFSSGDSDEEVKKFQGYIYKQTGNTAGNDAGVSTEGTQEEWYETPAAEKFSMAMTIIGTFDLALGLLLMGKQFCDNKKEEPQAQIDREDIRDTHTQVDAMHERMERMLKTNMEIVAKRELTEKCKQLADLANQQMLVHIQEKFTDIMKNHSDPNGQVDRNIALEEIKREMEVKMNGLLSSELAQYGAQVKQRYFDPFQIQYDAVFEQEALGEISEGTYRILNQTELFEDYCRSFEMNHALNRLEQERTQIYEEIVKCKKNISYYENVIKRSKGPAQEYKQKLEQAKKRLQQHNRNHEQIVSEETKIEKDAVKVKEKIRKKELDFRHIRR